MKSKQISPLENATTFLEKIEKKLQSIGIKISQFEIDHLCYRVETIERYNKLKDEFSEYGVCLIESPIGGRNIATFKLHEPIEYNESIIDLIELPAPKKNSPHNEGFEHIEMIISESYESFRLRYPKVSFETKALSKGLNPEFEIKFKDCAVKFHFKSLEEVIAIEKNEQVMNFLNESQILKKLTHYSPCLSGSIPLGVQTPDSDLDILFQSSDLKTFEDDVATFFQSTEEYSQKRETYQNIESSIIKFKFNDLSVELFCQNKPVYEQNANKHFLMEARLLKIFGEKLRLKIKKLKEKGMATEIAFGEALDLEEPYEELIQLYKLSDIEIIELFQDII